MSDKVSSKMNNFDDKIKTDKVNKINNPGTNSPGSGNKSGYHLIPILIILCVIPLLVRIKIYNTNLSQFSWFSSNDKQIDFFLIYKQWAFLLISAIMAAVIIVNIIIKKKEIKFLPVFIPLAIYGVLALLSAVFSEYSAFSFSGSFEMFESVFVLLGYCITAYYSFLMVNSEQDLKSIYKFLIIIAFIMSFLGLTQILGHDFFTTQLGYNLITPEEMRGTQYELTFDKIYLSLYNPNYVGVYAALLLPVFTVMACLMKKVIWVLLSGVSVVGLAMCLVGSASLAGEIGLCVGLIFFLILMWRSLIKYFYITVPVFILTLIGITFIIGYKDKDLIDKIKNTFEISKTQRTLTNLETEDDKITLTYNGNLMNVMYILNQNKTNASIFAYDSDNLLINTTYDETNKLYSITDDRFPGFILGFDNENQGIFYIQINGVQWRFTNLAGDNKYYYINRYNKLDKIITAPSVLFTGYERLATGRGYIWSRTIPLLKDKIILGSGPDTFTMVFPHQDYMNLYSFGYGDNVLTKPHNMYLQMAVQTGVLSLIAFLAFYGIYFISSFVLYIKGCFGSLYAKLGLAIFIGTISYMVTGLTNDSNLNTSPVFWTVIGVGIAANYKARSFVREEVALIKGMKTEKKTKSDL